MTFRRMLLGGHSPRSIFYDTLTVTDIATNTSTVVPFSKDNEFGYMFTLPTKNDYWLHWHKVPRTDPTAFVLHKIDALTEADYVFIETRYVKASGCGQAIGRSTIFAAASRSEWKLWQYPP